MLQTLLTPELLQAHGFTFVDLEPGNRTHLCRVFDASEDDICDHVLDVLVMASGRWLSEEDLEGGEIAVIFNTETGALAWTFATNGPWLQGLEHTFAGAEQQANALRFLSSLVGSLPIAVAEIGCTYGVENGQLLINGKPVCLTWPAADRVVDVSKSHDAVMMSYDSSDGSRAEVDLLNVVGTWA